MIHLEGINKTYFNGAPLHVLKGIDLDIEKGEMVSIMGASGSGKSTLLNILGILDTYDTGIYTLNGQLIRNLSETRAAELRNRMIGFIFQSFNLISFKNAVENVALPLYYQGVGRKKRNAMAMEYLDESWHVTQVRAEYKKPAYLHDTLIPVIYEQGNRMQVQLTNEQHETLCIVEFTHE